MATPAATGVYRDRFGDEFDRRYFRRFGGCAVSSIGAGTYPGEPTDEVDERYREALVAAFESGVNVVDTAIDYRHGRSERVVGRALEDADVDREAVLVATKGGVVPFDGGEPPDPGAYVRSEFVEPGLVDPEDLAGGTHCIAPEFIDHQLDRSLDNLGLETVDLYYVHTPEAQLAVRSRDAVYDQLEAAFTRLEERIAAGDVRWYGVATREAFHVEQGSESYLSLAEVVSRARAAAETAGASEPHLRAVQLPFNPLFGDAFTVWSQETGDGTWNVLGAAERTDLHVFSCETLAGGQVIGELTDDVAVWFEGDTTAQRAINFARSAPGVTCALVGMRSADHVWQNVRAGRFRDMGSEAFEVVFERA